MMAAADGVSVPALPPMQRLADDDLAPQHSLCFIECKSEADWEEVLGGKNPEELAQYTDFSFVGCDFSTLPQGFWGRILTGTAAFASHSDRRKLQSIIFKDCDFSRFKVTDFRQLSLSLANLNLTTATLCLDNVNICGIAKVRCVQILSEILSRFSGSEEIIIANEDLSGSDLEFLEFNEKDKYRGDVPARYRPATIILSGVHINEWSSENLEKFRMYCLNYCSWLIKQGVTSPQSREIRIEDSVDTTAVVESLEKSHKIQRTTGRESEVELKVSAAKIEEASQTSQKKPTLHKRFNELDKSTDTSIKAWAKKHPGRAFVAGAVLAVGLFFVGSVLGPGIGIPATFFIRKAILMTTAAVVLGGALGLIKRRSRGVQVAPADGSGGAVDSGSDVSAASVAAAAASEIAPSPAATRQSGRTKKAFFDGDVRVDDSRKATTADAARPEEHRRQAGGR